MSLKPAAFQACFATWLQSLRTTAAAAAGTEQPILAIDGKTARRSHDRSKGLGALHSVSVWASEFGLSLGQVACAEKSNEITAIPEVLRLVDITGAIITIDAMGTQKAIAAQIIEGEGDYVLALKGNQGTLHQAIIEHIDEQLEGDLAQAHEHVTIEKGHGREEMRTYLQLPAPESLPGFAQWKGLKSIGVATSRCLRDGKETVEVRYYISSLAVSVKKFAHAVRSHWGIENSLSLEPRYHLPRGRIADSGSAPARELCVAQADHLVALEATSEPQKCGHETQQLRLERNLHAGSPYWSNRLVCAGPAFPPSPNGANFNHNLYVDFTNPVNDLQFNYGYINSTGVIGEVNVYQNGSFSTTVPMYGGSNDSIGTEDLSAYDNITRIEIVEHHGSGRSGVR